MAGKHRTQLGSKLANLKAALKRALEPEPKYPYEPGNLQPDLLPDLIGDIKALGFKDYQTLLDTISSAVSGKLDDDDLLLERLAQLLAKLPADRERQQLTDALLTKLWNGLTSPPPLSAGDEFKYRSADGSGNNINYPQLGAANTPYARTVPARIIQNPNQPDPAAIFDALMARGDKFEPHPQGLSSMFFYLATIIIHDLFQTSSADNNINLTSSYADLSPLYGRNEEEQIAMRQFKDGLLKPDCFSSKRILESPPGCSVFLIMFNRFHNYVVTQLARINQNNRFTKPNPDLFAGDDDDSAALERAWKKYDNDLFQTGRLITCGLYANIILNDYLKTILALNRTKTSWNLDPRSPGGKDILSHPAPTAVGNQISVEFNLIYRWHSTISQRDEEWTTQQFSKILGGGDKDPNAVGFSEMLVALREFEAALPDDPAQRRFGGLVRDLSSSSSSDGTYNDDDLIKILAESVQDPAGSFGANRVPDVLRTVEMLGILQARYWNVATLNEFRSFIGLTTHETFEDINPDPVVARRLQDLYDSPDSVELYPGLIAEKAKPPVSPGSGLCVNYTTSRAILNDAVHLIRGDRFYTLDFTPKNLTNWGFNEVSSDPETSQGHMMHKLIFRAFPNGQFEPNSIYAHFPFVIPEENKKIHDQLGIADKYSWDAPLVGPRKVPTTAIIRSYLAVKSVLANPETFRVSPWGEAISVIASPPVGSSENAKNFCLAGDGTKNHLNRVHIWTALYGSPPGGGWEEEVRKFCEGETAELLNKYSAFSMVNGDGDGRYREVDVVRDVFGLATTRTMAALFGLQLKNEKTPHGFYTEQELFGILVILFSSIFFDADEANSPRLREKAKKLAGELAEVMVLSAKKKSGFKKDNEVPNFGLKLVERFLKMSGGDVDKAVWGSMLMTLVAGVANQTQLLTQCLDYYLGEGKEHLGELKRLAREGSREADDKLMKYMLEGSRIRGTIALYRGVTADLTIMDYIPCKHDPSDAMSLKPIPVDSPEPTAINLNAGSVVLVDLTTACHDAAAFPDPEQVKVDRPLDSYIHYG